MYADTVREFSPNHDPRHIQAFMLLQYGTLGHLSRDDFRREAEICRACVDEDAAAAERLAQSFGL